jgi:hypothetical protein
LRLLLIPQRDPHPTVRSAAANGKRMTAIVEFVSLWLVSLVMGHGVS